MLLRIAVFILLSASVFAGDFIDSWKPGQTKTYQYQIKTFKPKETTNYITLTVTRDETEKIAFTVNQKIEIPDQKISMNNTDKYEGDDLQLISSDNFIKFPKEMIAKMGVDTVRIKAVRKGDSLMISSNSLAVPGHSITAQNIITATGSLFTSRNMNLQENQVTEYNYVNFMMISGKPYESIVARDSVVGHETLETTSGKFDCIKVKNIVANIYSYTYYTDDALRLPVRVELINPQDNQTVQTLTLMKTE
jgi:hypothetical protein